MIYVIFYFYSTPSYSTILNNKLKKNLVLKAKHFNFTYIYTKENVFSTLGRVLNQCSHLTSLCYQCDIFINNRNVNN